MHKCLISSALFAAAMLSTVAGAARADTVTSYLSAAAFDAQVGSGLTAIPFDDQLPAGSTFGFNNDTFHVSGVSFHASGTGGVSVLALTRAPFGFGSDAYLEGGVTFNQMGPNASSQDGTLYADLPAGVTAVGFDLGIGLYNLPLDVDAVTASGDHVQQVMLPGTYGLSGFVGFVSDSPISQISITGHAADLSPGLGTNTLIDNFRFGSPPAAPTAAPLPAAANAGGALLVLIGAAALRRRHVAR